MSQPLLKLKDLSVELGGNPILRKVNAEFERGKITALLGLNGSGKTTLLRALLKEVPYTGEMRFFCGHDHSLPRPVHIGYVPQKLRIEANLPVTVRDMLALTLQQRPLFFGISRSTEGKMLSLLHEVFSPVPEDILNRHVDRLSGGELQRVLMGLAMYPDPELLLLDEPAAGVDFKDQESFYELIKKLNAKKGVTVILVSHEVEMVSKNADHVLCL